MTPNRGIFRDMTSPMRIASYLWLAWLLSWILAAGWSAPTVARQPVWERLLHLLLLGAGAVLLFGQPARTSGSQRPLVALAPWICWAALGLVLTGFLFAWGARLSLGRLWSGNVTLKAGHALVRSGPYRVTRHPIYTGLLVSLAATAVIRDEAAALVGLGLIVGGLLFKVHKEERLLRAHFGAAYDEYRAAVPALIPRPWRRIRPTTVVKP
jgi:protein-S-isoprenylcysteine O-methyltransferase Ste14